MIQAFEVINVKCAGCANTLKTKLLGEFGNIEVNLEVEPRQITLDIEENALPSLRKKLKSLGYPMSDEDLSTIEKICLPSKGLVQLIEDAHNVLGEYTLSHTDFSAASVAAALLTTQGNVYTGINIDVACGIGFCAEHSAIAEMLKSRETQIEMIVAVNAEGIRPPCGRCRELMLQIDNKNINTKVYLSKEKYMRLDELLPLRWKPSN